MALKKIGDTTRDGLLVIADTSWDGSGGLRVAIREVIGERGYFNNPANVKRARTLARGAIMYPEKTRRSPVLRKGFHCGSSTITFLVSRNDD